jgi:hypothetical protein
MRVSPTNQRVRLAVTKWSAIAAGVYTGRLGWPANYDPRHDDRLPERMIARLAETFDEVTGQTSRKKT